jgi:glyceraldehyde 3-phosphate dehydrogenase
MSGRVVINGFGRIGRCILRAGLGAPGFEVVAVNDLSDAATLAHLFRYDSVHGTFEGDVRVIGEALLVAGREIRVLSEEDPGRLPWRDLRADVVLECTGRFRSRAECARHLEAGARKVIVSAPADDPDLTVVMGLNHGAYDPARHHVLSNASCTTNCLALVAKVLNDRFGVESGFVTTVHSYTNDQRILDLPHKDLRRARAAAVSIIPTTTGAARAVGLVLPDLAGKLDGVSLRVPTPNVSLADFTAVLARRGTVEEVNDALREAAEGPFRGLLSVSEEPLVSVDFNGNPHSAIVDALSTAVVGNQVKVLAWYDNEWGFSMRMVELARLVAQKG